MKINWSEQSINDLREIISYVGQSFGKQKASEVLENIRSNAERLAMFPLIGKSFVTDQEAEIAITNRVSRVQNLYFELYFGRILGDRTSTGQVITPQAPYKFRMAFRQMIPTPPASEIPADGERVGVIP